MVQKNEVMEKRQAEYHDAGWNLSIHGDNAYVGLWSCWMKNRFHLTYPYNADVSDRMIMNTLDVTYAKPVTQVDAITMTGPDKEDPMFKDADKPLEINERGHTIAYKERYGQRLWAKFYGPQTPKGRVWIDTSGNDTYNHQFPMVIAGQLFTVSGHKSIATFEFDGHNKYAPEGPTTTEGEIQAYREKFLKLAVEIALQSTNPNSVAIKYDNVYITPEDAEKDGWKITQHMPGFRKVMGWQEPVVRAEKGDEIVFLEARNASEWRTTRYKPVTEKTANGILKLIDGLFTF